MSPLIRLLASFIALMMAMGIGRFALPRKCRTCSVKGRST